MPSHSTTDQLQGFTVAIIATEGVEQAELTEPAKALGQAGAKVDILSLQEGKLQAFNHHDRGDQIPVDRTVVQADASRYDGLLLPGGALNADVLRADTHVLHFIKEMANAGKPIAAICHAPWELISAGLVKGKNLTSYYTLQDDLRNAGAHWTDEEVVVDGSLVTSRHPGDIPAFNREMIALFQRSPRQQHTTINQDAEASAHPKA